MCENALEGIIDSIKIGLNHEPFYRRTAAHAVHFIPRTDRRLHHARQSGSVIDAFVDELNLLELGFSSANPQATGRPAYHPGTLLKLFIYGYLNKLQSSRRLEREANRNLELMWLLGRLAPGFKTIADFRKDNSEGIKSCCRQFVMLCKRLNLFADSLIAIDGSRFMAVNNRERNYTKAKVKRRIDAINTSIDQYLSQIDSFDRQKRTIPEAKAGHIHKQLDSLKR